MNAALLVDAFYETLENILEKLEIDTVVRYGILTNKTKVVNLKNFKKLVEKWKKKN